MRPSHRRGFNLAELLFVISAISGLSVLAMTVIGLLMTAEQHSAEALWVDLTISNLATDLRNDAHLATELTITTGDDGRALTVTFLQPADSHVTYECTPDNVIRRQMQRGDVQASETYRLALGSSWFEPPGDEGLLTWRHVRSIPDIGGFSQPTPGTAAVQQNYQVQAAVGLHASVAGEDVQ